MKAVTPLEFEKPLVELEKMLAELLGHSAKHNIDLHVEINSLKAKIVKTRKRIYENLTPWQRVQIVRHPARPYALDYIERIVSNFTELHGDRLYSDDKALVGGVGEIDGKPVLVLGHQKGRNTKENIMRNFGCAHPEGYRKALRLMKMAHKFKLPIICFIDTPGAYPGIAAEERHIAEAIAVNIREMFNLEVPIIAVVIGEGGSGGALGIGVADRVLILENAYYSVISPEGCASILWKDRAYAPQAAEALKMSAENLLRMKLVDTIIPEPQGGAHYNWDKATESLRGELVKHLDEVSKLGAKQLLEQRYERYRHYGKFTE
ncbi:MAG: acetyl-CoA carboxylase carboxyltransferase subunit alpha [Verrucomicrobiales bacterium]|jgi:acetyl-CoA carboxylase carboxyl transferase subunit alpha|nr:acetyl-CoA carboxylase carboxyltransferase subunit alpha [Verrucomicrobiales bacterium]